MTVEATDDNAQEDGQSLAISGTRHKLRVFIPNSLQNRFFSVYWIGSLHPRGLSEWAATVLRTHHGNARLVLDRWDGWRAAPVSYSSNDLDRLTRDLRRVGDSNLTVSVLGDEASDPSFYLWGHFSPDSPAGDRRTQGEVGLKMGIDDLARSEGRSVLAKVVEVSAPPAFTTDELDKLLNDLSQAVRAMPQATAASH